MSADASPRKGAGAFSIRMVLGLVVVGVVSFAAFIVLSAFADDLRSPEEGGEHALSKSAVGFCRHGAAAAAERAHVRTSRGSFSQVGSHDELAVMTPPLDGVGRLGADPRRPERRADRSAEVASLPRPRQSAVGDVRGTCGRGEDRKDPRRDRPDGEGGAVRGRQGRAADDRRQPGGIVQTGRIDTLQVIEGESIVPVLSDVEGRTVLGPRRLWRGRGAWLFDLHPCRA